MNAIIDKILLFISCLIVYLIHIDSIYFIIPVILSVMLSCFSTYFENTRISFAGNICFMAMCFIMPSFILFLPLLIYDIIHTKYQPYLIMLIILLLIYNKGHYSQVILIYMILNTFLSFVLKLKTDKIGILLAEYNELRDSSSSLSSLLKEKNISLLKNHDYEIRLATLNERSRISKDIHDNIGHLLTRALLQVGALKTFANDDTIKEGLSSLSKSLSKGMDDIRNSIHQMYDESIDLYTQIESITKNFNFCLISHDYDINTPPSLEIKQCIIYTVKEALSNIIRHSNATKVNLILREHPAMYQLIIEDNGSFNKTNKEALQRKISNKYYNDGIGLQNIFDRIRVFNGNVNITLDNGFRLFITIPKQKGNR